MKKKTSKVKSKTVFGIKYSTKEDLQEMIDWAENEIMEYMDFVEECKKLMRKSKKLKKK